MLGGPNKSGQTWIANINGKKKTRKWLGRNVDGGHEQEKTLVEECWTKTNHIPRCGTLFTGLLASILRYLPLASYAAALIFLWEIYSYN